MNRLYIFLQKMAATSGMAAALGDSEMAATTGDSGSGMSDNESLDGTCCGLQRDGGYYGRQRIWHERLGQEGASGAIRESRCHPSHCPAKQGLAVQSGKAVVILHIVMLRGGSG